LAGLGRFSDLVKPLKLPESAEKNILQIWVIKQCAVYWSTVGMNIVDGIMKI
jgi:hypothetical protein